jgi:hypothetical protein
VGNTPTGRIDPSGLSWLSRRWAEVKTYGGAVVEGVGEGAKNLAIGAGNMVVEVGQIARDTGNAAISLGSQATDWAFGTGVYQFDLHSKTIGGYDVAVKSGSGGAYLGNAMANGASLGVKPLVEGVIDFANTGDATNASQTSGGVAAGNLAGAGLLRVGGPAWANEPITLWRPRPPAPNRIYSARELIRRAEEPGPYHNFPESFNQVIFNGNRQVVSPNYILYTQRGYVNGRPGTFEIGVRPSATGSTEVIVHRFFRPD